METTNNEKKTKIKKQKKQGPIRWGAIIVCLCIFAIIGLYFHFLFDFQMRKTLEFVGTKVNGAEVNIAAFKTSFFDASLKIGGIQFTNAENPSQNTLQIGEIRFKLLWDALLRAKFVVNEAAIETIEFDAPRAQVGKVIPPEPPTPQDGETLKALEKASNMITDEVSDKNQGNALGDIANILGGANSGDIADNIKDQLKSEKNISELKTALAEKEKNWQTKFATLPQGKDLQELQDRAKKIKLSNFKTPQELQDSINQINSVIKDGEAKVKTLSDASSDLSKDLSSFNTSLKELDKLIKDDIKDLESRFKIPKLDTKDLAMSLFRKQFGPYLIKYYKYKTVADKYLPPPKPKGTVEETKFVVHERSKGRNYSFGRPHSYPLLWVKKIIISSKASPQIPLSGNLNGQITDVTSSQDIIGKPTIGVLKGDFPGKKVFGINSKLTLDYRGENSLENLNTVIASFPVDGRSLSDSDDVKFSINKASGALSFQVERNHSRFKMEIQNTLKEIGYLIEAKNKDVESALKGIVNDIPVINVTAKAEGDFPNLDWDIRSNLVDDLRKGFEKQLNAFIEQKKAQVQKIIDDRIGAEKAKLTKQFDSFKNQYEGEINKLKAQFEKSKTEGQKQIDESKKQAEKEAKGKVEQEAKKLLDDPNTKKQVDDLKKKLGF